MAPDSTLQELWAMRNFTPNEEQRKAIEHTDGPLYLPAGPGSGKTRVLLWRTLNLIVYKGVKPEEIFLSTFTEKAARQLREGISTLLSFVQNHTDVAYDVGRMYVGTVHSLCQRLIRDRRLYGGAGVTNLPALLDELGQYFFVQQNWNALVASCSWQGDDVSVFYNNINAVIGGHMHVNSKSKYVAMTNAISFFNRCSEEYVQTSSIIAQVQDPTIIHLLQIYDAYLNLLKQSKQLDFSMLQGQAYELIMNSALAGNIFKHVIIDEYQDTNPIQEKLFFSLARQHKNICVVGDDDQALYRFRGATVENFVRFTKRVQTYLDVNAVEVPLSVNYRSHNQIVELYQDYMRRGDWDVNGIPWRRAKNIQAHRRDNDLHNAVYATTANIKDGGSDELAAMINRLIVEKKVDDPNQIGVLFPSLQWQGEPNDKVVELRAALAKYGIKVYAPRAGRFLAVEEAKDVFGVLMHILGKPEFDVNLSGVDYDNFARWSSEVYTRGQEILDSDLQMKRWVQIRVNAINERVRDLAIMEQGLSSHGYIDQTPYDPDGQQFPNIKNMLKGLGISQNTVRGLGGQQFDEIARQRLRTGNPFQARQLMARATTFDYTVLDLFYQMLGFPHFKQMLDQAQGGGDEGPTYNLSMISQYLARFIADQWSALLRARDFRDSMISRTFWMGFIYVIYRRGESEYEDEEMRFPKGRVPFLTIHQSKGLEFPVVVIGNPNRRDQRQKMESVMRTLVEREREPETHSATYDSMRLFYVALSRAKHLCVIAHYSGHMHQSMKPLLRDPHDIVKRLPDFETKHFPQLKEDGDVLPKRYSYTSDFLAYKRCGRQYMLFRKYDFAPSQTRAQMFGSLVHRTIEEIHQRMIAMQNEVSS